LGLKPEDVGKQALARAAVSPQYNGTVRHTAALALATLMCKVLGLEAIQEGMKTLATAAPPGRRWRRVQALAQMRAAGFPLPQLSLGLLAQVNAWHAGIRLFAARWLLVAQAIGAGLGGGLGLMLSMAVVLLAIGYRSLGEIASYLLVGGVVGVLFAGGHWLFDVLLASRAGRVLGGAVGFCLGLLALAPFTPALTGWQLLGGLLAGGAAAGGWEMADGRWRMADGRWQSAISLAALGGALGGALGFAATVLSPLRLPFVLRPEVLEEAFGSVMAQPGLAVLAVAAAALAGAAMGAGLASGGAAGESIWSRLSEM
jgi:hypothetical protein